MFIALDGSAKGVSDEEYMEEYANLYVAQAFRESSQRNKIYERGPGVLSHAGSRINIRKIANAAINFMNRHTDDTNDFLMGWSRGAAACIQVAHDLKNQGTPRRIDALFLLDAVDMDTSTNSDLNAIPDSVDNCFHAIATDKNLVVRNMVFPTCGTSAASGVNFVTRKFKVSHGGIAGSGDNGAGSARVRAWMWGHLVRIGAI